MFRRVVLVWTDVSEERPQSPANASSSLAVFFYTEDGYDMFLRNVG
jgi:hypothetical protein